ncbi:hypothetical protein PIB30_085705 [Stylosanthes scabra]|uniref:Uncharacterized protein n=1 Tax=Stylosanthes scabra TaxID=79078 RepID=A0ABU6VT31_9FABA|nr:hypothetical protein [Stylosanthes scabra]
MSTGRARTHGYLANRSATGICSYMPNPPIQVLSVATGVWLRDNLNDDRVRRVSHPALIPCSGGEMRRPPDVLSPTCGHRECVDVHRIHRYRLICSELPHHPVYMMHVYQVEAHNRDE